MKQPRQRKVVDIAELPESILMPVLETQDGVIIEAELCWTGNAILSPSSTMFSEARLYGRRNPDLRFLGIIKYVRTDEFEEVTE